MTDTRHPAAERDGNWAAVYERGLTLNEWQDWLMLKDTERAFAKATGWHFEYGRYWETMTITELREVQK